MTRRLHLISLDKALELTNWADIHGKMNNHEEIPPSNRHSAEIAAGVKVYNSYLGSYKKAVDYQTQLHSDLGYAHPETQKAGKRVAQSRTALDNSKAGLSKVLSMRGTKANSTVAQSVGSSSDPVGGEWDAGT